MIGNIAVAGIAAIMLGGLPALAQAVQAQQDIPELAGGPGYRAAEQEAAKRAEAQKKAAQQASQKQAQAAADKLKADQAKYAQQAEAQKAEQARLAKQAAELKALQARLDARAAELAGEENRLAQLRVDQESEQASKLAALDRERDEAGRSQRQTADLSVEANGARPGGEPDRNAGDDATADDAGDDLPDATPETRRPVYARLDFENAERSCARAGEDAALTRDFYSARYDTAPRIYQDGGWELRGLMRLQDRRGYLVVDTVCEVDADGKVQRFALLR